MLRLKNVKTIHGTIETISLKSEQEETFDAQEKLTIMPALIDPHVHFRVPGAEHKEDWKTGAQAAIAGGVTTVFDMPNNTPPCTTKKALIAKKQLIDQQLAEIGIPLRYHLFLGADQDHFDEINKCKNDIIGIKVYMGSSTGGLVMQDEKALERVFQIAAFENLIVAVHAEDEMILQQQQRLFGNSQDPSIHSKIRDRKAAIKATETAISLAEKYSAQLFVLHISTKEEVQLIRQAKERNLLVYGETTPHHLFLTEKDYQHWGTKVQINPPLRTESDQQELWRGIHDNTIDTIGSDHAPHTLEEKSRPYGEAPSGVPGIETTLPLLLNAYHEKRLSLVQIVALTRRNIEEIYNLPHHEDSILVDLEMVKEVRDLSLKCKCKWSPFAGKKLRGWPVYTILRGKLFHVST